MIAPLMTCSARLPVYALLIGAFIPSARWLACSTCRAWCCLRCTWPASWALAVAWVLKLARHQRRPGAHADDGTAPLPLAHLRNLGHRPVERVVIFSSAWAASSWR
jgi:ferrous iron transport protein B